MFRCSLIVAFAIACCTAGKPNFVTIVADDLGYFDSGLAGNVNVSTRNLDKLVKVGVKLERHYGYKYCSPSRRALVTGRWPLHLDEMNQVQDGIDLRSATLGDKLSGAGYETALIGKTHWGIATTDHLPINRGWQSHLGYLGGGESYWSGHQCATGDGTVNCHNFTSQLDMWHDKKPAQKEYIGEYSTDLFSEQAVKLIEHHEFARKPLWLHLNYQAVHNPQTTPPGEDKHSDNGSLVFYEVLQRMDAGIARVIKALQQRGVWNNTLVLFMSDNGAASLGNNYPLRGGKYSPWEGGVRVQTALFGGLLPQKVIGTTFSGLLHVTDWYPTLCKLAGVDPSDNPTSKAATEWFYPIDGFDVWDYITKGTPDPHGPIVLSSLVTSGPGGGALVDGKYKIVIDAENNAWDQPPNDMKSSPKVSGLSNQTCIPGTGPPSKCKVCTVQRPCLYDVDADRSEIHDLAEAKPHILRGLNSTFHKLVYERRMPVLLNFTEKGGWQCKSKCPGPQKECPWGVYIGPVCWCTAKDGNCTHE